jgi:hypothetical protein
VCPSLGRLGKLLQTAYAVKDGCLSDNKDVEAIREVERNLRRIHNLITHHRSSCRFCQFNEARVSATHRVCNAGGIHSPNSN